MAEQRLAKRQIAKGGELSTSGTTLTLRKRTLPDGVRVKDITCRCDTAIDAAELAKATTSIERFIECSVDGGATWRMLATDSYDASKLTVEQAGPLEYSASCRDDLIPDSAMFRSRIVNHGESLSADCSMEAT